MKNEQVKSKNRMKGVFLPSAMLISAFFLFGVIIAATIFPNCNPFLDVAGTLYFSEDGIYNSFWTYGFLNMMVSLCRYYLCVYILGFFSFGVFAIPVAASYRGFSLMSAVYTMYACGGANGVLAALAAIGIQSAVTIPCFFVISSYSFDSSLSVLRYSIGKPLGENRNIFALNTAVLSICVAVTLIPVVLNMLAVPKLLEIIICR